MKGNRLTFGVWGAIIAIVAISPGLLQPAYSRTSSSVLLLQKTPFQGGKTTPDVGVHRFDANAPVVLTAIPKAGYQFVYWLGDVSDPTENSTTVSLDSPKIVIAVFEQVLYGAAVAEGQASGGPGGGLVANYERYATYAAKGSGVGPKPPKIHYEWPVPEPTAAGLIIGGSLFAFAGRGAKKEGR
ncbi:MAG TPA: hypothetical protein VMW16_09710 [Sedimentisphaerales bacterium]|nr:hypothetical protein [Sedimentisphaerales bacterium]